MTIIFIATLRDPSLRGLAVSYSQWVLNLQAGLDLGEELIFSTVMAVVGLLLCSLLSLSLF